jgi:hypothetical protein
MGFLSGLSFPISITQIFRGKTRAIAQFTGYTPIQEDTDDILTVTKQPVQQGASITDHSFKEPTMFTAQILLQAGFTESLSDIYDRLRELQDSRQPFEIYTPKRFYPAMLMVGLRQRTDKQTENCLSITMTCQEVILVPVTTVIVPKQAQRIPKVTQKTQSTGRKSALRELGDASSIPAFLRR